VRSWTEGAGVGRIPIAINLLGKKTLARSKDTFLRTFAPRFLHGDPPDAWRLVRSLEDRNADPEILFPIYYWITARSDRLLYNYVTQELVHIADTLANI
jgi:hypothetical protein